MRKKDDRLNKLIEILKLQNGVAVKELAVMLGVSEMTVRRDLEALKERDLILDIPGVAVLNSQHPYSAEDDKYQLSQAVKAHMKEKERIGRFAASLIHEDDCIIIDNGSTAERLAANLPLDTKITVFTCSLNIMNMICNNPNISVIFGGGYYHADTAMCESPETVPLIRNVRATKVFTTASGVHDKMGVTCMNNYEPEIKQAIIQSGAEKILLVDSSKFGVIKPCFLTDIESFDRVITDKNIPEEWAELITEKQIRLDIV